MDKPHKRLKAWQLGMEIAETVYKMTQSFPKEELYGLVSQMRRCPVSIPSNIAEGAARNSKKELIHFLYVALGSLSELDTQIELSNRLQYIKSSIFEFKSLDSILQEADRVIIGLIKYQGEHL